MKEFALRPRLSEKAYGLSQSHNVYAIDVPAGSNKMDVVHAVKKQFDVEITNVRIANKAPKAKRTISKKGRVAKYGHTTSVKKAYVTIKSGQNLPFFAAIEEAETKEQEAQKKLADKAKAKETKEKPSVRKSLRLRNRKQENA